MKQADIYVNDVFCGVLTEDEEGYHFFYTKEYLARNDATPISPTMPLTEQQYDKEMYLAAKLQNQVRFISKTCLID